MGSDPVHEGRLNLGIGRLFELVSDAVIVASGKTGRVVLWNPGAAAMFGIDAQAAEGMPLARLVPEPLRPRHLAGIARYGRREPSNLVDTRIPVELPALKGDGSSFWVEMQLSSVPMPDNAIVDERYVIAIIRDVTKRKAAEAEAVASSDQLRAANEGLRSFLAAVAHDIVGPAGGIKGAADLIVDAEDPAEVRELAELIARQAELVTELGHELGQLAVIEQGTVPVHPAELSLRAIVQAALEASANPTDDVEAQISDGLRLYADATHATRVVANLIGNARKYGKPPITLEAKEYGGHVELRVRDRGSGVPEDFAERLFEKFTRAQTGGMGLGLGLAISRGLAQANGGDVWYEPTDEPGATFVARFPRARP